MGAGMNINIKESIPKQYRQRFMLKCKSYFDKRNISEIFIKQPKSPRLPNSVSNRRTSSWTNIISNYSVAAIPKRDVIR